jgi:hypothetical protein
MNIVFQFYIKKFEIMLLLIVLISSFLLFCKISIIWINPCSKSFLATGFWLMFSVCCICFPKLRKDSTASNIYNKYHMVGNWIASGIADKIMSINPLSMKYIMLDTSSLAMFIPFVRVKIKFYLTFKSVSSFNLYGTNSKIPLKYNYY